MTEQELVNAVLTELQKNKKDISVAEVINALKGGEMVVCYNDEGKISRISPQTLATANNQAIDDLANALFDAIADEATRAKAAEKTIESNAMQYSTLGVSVYADRAELYGRSIDTKIRTCVFPAATTENAGVMNASDKKKLDGISTSVYLTEEAYQTLVSRGEVQDDVEYNIYEE